MNLWKEIQLINELLSSLFERTVRDFHESGDLWRDERTRRVCQLLTPLTDSLALDKALPSERSPVGRLATQKKLLFLELVEKDSLLPILDMRWNLTDPNSPELRFRFFLLHWPDEDPQTKPDAVGFRLETPEGKGKSGPGSHDFYHAQMIKGFEKGDDVLEELLEDLTPWVPISQPAFPLPADSPADLLIVLLVSIYGSKQLSGLALGSRQRTEIIQRLKRMGIT